MSSQDSAQRVALYIDGFNLYHAIVELNKPKLKWLNLAALGKNLIRSGESLVKVEFFTTVIDWDLAKKARHEAYVAALKAKGVIVTEGKFKRTRRECFSNQTTCMFREEKRTDVAIAVSVLSDAHDDIFDRMILLTADTDQIPLIERLQTRFPRKGITWLAPPQRLQQAREIGSLIADRSELTEGQIANCRLPKIICDEAGDVIARMPADYA